ncbi:hypothetical protein M378DRAFT_76250 [Amanita muscaria Koide BX008]|uniref:DNA ligase n=1 Tax=Amanita muscaria (strain Koide BX008) TaxID=946122 RepID=A0A0C2XAW8_AMAMK|nr:hypothetical protein M378DRAFT_76250 [Amanita muscaria Koide BX008]
MDIEQEVEITASPKKFKAKTKLTVAVNSTPNSIVYSSLNVDPATYNPTSQPLSKASVPYSFLTHSFASLSQTRSRIQILNILTNALRTVIHYDARSLLPSLYLLSNSLAPAYEAVELGLGPSIISRVIQNVSGLSSAAIKQLYISTGDPGDVAFEAKSNLRTLIPHPPLLVTFVYDNLLKIATCKGQGAGKEKEKIVERLLVAAAGEEVRYLTRTLCQNLRVGAVRTSILTALARSMVLTPLPSLAIPDTGNDHHVTSELLARISNDQSVLDQERRRLADMYVNGEKLLKRVFVQHPNYGHIVAALLQVGLPGLSGLVPLTIGVPLHPTLGSPIRSLQEVYNLLGDLPFSAEYKYDGQRAQVHASNQGGEIMVKIFSRHLEDMTMKYPDVVSLIESIFTEQVHISSFIMDSEIVAVDPHTSQLKSFQELSNRAKKYVNLEEIQVPVCVFAFDLMYLNGDILIEKGYRERGHLLRSRFPPFKPTIKGAASFDHVRSRESIEGEDRIQQFWQEAVESRCEGIMVKLLDSGAVEDRETNNAQSRRKPLPAGYEPDKRTTAWLKLKKDYVAGIGDTLDLVPIGAWHGNGRKFQWWSPILLALWDPGRGLPVAVCKCMSGFTDVFYKALAERYSVTDGDTMCSSRPVWECDLGGFKPDVYFRPQEVWEIRGADITISPVSTAARGLVDNTKGLSIRFPRFVRTKDDKNIEDASTPLFLANIWRSQQALGQKIAGVKENLIIDAESQSEESVEELSD